MGEGVGPRTAETAEGRDRAAQESAPDAAAPAASALPLPAGFRRARRKRTALTGNEAVALAMRQVEPDVVAAYPITPQTDIVQFFASFVADGRVKTEFVTVESEHSAMSAVVGASAAGARAMTATSANGLALMWEVLYIASGSRLPIVMPVVNRALSAPINIHCDHSDAMGARDSGWVQLWSEDAQEAYDNVIQAVRIAEDPRVLLPVMVCYDGFIISHALLNLEVLTDDEVKEFVGTYRPDRSLLDPDRPVTVGPLDLYDFYFEHKRQQAEAMAAARAVIPEVAAAYAALTGRSYGMMETYRLADAKAAVVVLGSAAGTARFVVDRLRREGRKAGLLKLRVFRPFPACEMADALRGLHAVAVMDRCDGFSAAGGPVFNEVRSALYGLHGERPDAARRPQGRAPNGPPLVVNVVYGLGGRDVDPEDIEAVFDLLFRRIEGEEPRGEDGAGVLSRSLRPSPNTEVHYLGVRE